MNIGDTAPYRRARFGNRDRFVTGSLIFDLHRPMKGKARSSLSRGADTTGQAHADPSAMPDRAGPT